MANKKKVLMLEDLAKRIEQYEKDKTKVHEIECKELGGLVRVIKIDRNKALDYLQEMEICKSDDFEKLLDICVQIIYESVPVFRDKSLQKLSDDLFEPSDIVYKLFHDNIVGIQQLAADIMSLHGFGGLKDEIKNS